MNRDQARYTLKFRQAALGQLRNLDGQTMLESPMRRARDWPMTSRSCVARLLPDLGLIRRLSRSAAEVSQGV